MFACILNTKPENSFSSGLTSLVSLDFGCGFGAISTKQSNSSRTPKLFKADPKNTGCNSPWRYCSLLNFGYTSSISSSSSLIVSAGFWPIRSSRSLEEMSSISMVSSMFLRLSPLNKLMFFSQRL